jgi:hypothetical protein
VEAAPAAEGVGKAAALAEGAVAAAAS